MLERYDIILGSSNWSRVCPSLALATISLPLHFRPMATKRKREDKVKVAFMRAESCLMLLYRVLEKSLPLPTPVIRCYRAVHYKPSTRPASTRLSSLDTSVPDAEFYSQARSVRSRVSFIQRPTLPPLCYLQHFSGA